MTAFVPWSDNGIESKEEPIGDRLLGFENRRLFTGVHASIARLQEPRQPVPLLTTTTVISRMLPSLIISSIQ